jgi:hypothetical protein
VFDHAVNPVEINRLVDLPKKMVGRNEVFEACHLDLVAHVFAFLNHLKILRFYVDYIIKALKFQYLYTKIIQDPSKKTTRRVAFFDSLRKCHDTSVFSPHRLPPFRMKIA